MLELRVVIFFSIRLILVLCKWSTPLIIVEIFLNTNSLFTTYIFMYLDTFLHVTFISGVLLWLPLLSSGVNPPLRFSKKEGDMQET